MSKLCLYERQSESEVFSEQSGTPRRAEVVMIDGGLAAWERPYQLYALSCYKVLDGFLREVITKIWSKALDEGYQLEPWLFAVTLERLHAVIVQHDWSDTNRARLEGVRSLKWQQPSLDEFVGRSVQIRNQLWDDEYELDLVLVAECGLRFDSMSYHLATRVFRLGWLAMTDNINVNFMLHAKRRAARTG